MKRYDKISSVKKSIGSMLLFLLICTGCKDDTLLGLRSQDHVPPQAPEVTRVQNMNGAAVIYYKIPKDGDLLSVTATYLINEKEYQAKASPYVDSLKVEGFGNEGEYKVFLTSEDKSKNKSEQVEVTINPKETPVELVYKTLDVKAAFGGIKILWEDPTESNLIIGVSYKDSIGDWINMENFYSSSKEGKATIRGLDTIPMTFGITIRDRWDNYSSKLESTQKPLFEVELAKNKFREVTKLPNDATPLKSDYSVSKIWDGNTTEKCFHSEMNGEVAIGKFITFDLGQKAQLSRYKMWQRTSNSAWFYTHNNVKRWRIYGSKELTVEMRETGSLEGWTLLEEALCHKPSGEGPVTNEDKEYILGGDEHEIPIELPSVRYIRIEILEMWGGGIIAQIAEMSFWGQIVNP